MKNLIAESHEAQCFREAVNESNINAIRNIFNQDNDELKEYCSNYMAGLEGSKLAELSKHEVWEGGDAADPEHE